MSSPTPIYLTNLQCLPVNTVFPKFNRNVGYYPKATPKTTSGKTTYYKLAVLQERLPTISWPCYRKDYLL